MMNFLLGMGIMYLVISVLYSFFNENKELLGWLLCWYWLLPYFTVMTIQKRYQKWNLPKLQKKLIEKYGEDIKEVKKFNDYKAIKQMYQNEEVAKKQLEYLEDMIAYNEALIKQYRKERERL